MAIWNGLHASETDLDRSVLHMESLNFSTKSDSISVDDYLNDPFVNALLDKGLERMHEKAKSQQGMLCFEK
jgi:hypothetical protein